MKEKIPLNLEDFDFHLDESLIAKYPLTKRDESRLMVINRKTGEISIEPFFRNIKNFISSGDLLVLNESRVSKRRAFLQNESKRIFEVLFLEKNVSSNSWKCLVRNLKKLKEKGILTSTKGNFQFLFEKRDEGYANFIPLGEFTEEDFEYFGSIPIPPYFKREAEEIDEKRYQTVFGEKVGSVAAPTAGLHFTKELISEIQSTGVLMALVRLDIGYGTFSPITEAQILQKRLHEEVYEIEEDHANLLTVQKQSQKKIFCVGTTTLRALESSFEVEKNHFRSGKNTTSLFIFPDDLIYSIDALVTNFHLPKSSLLLLVSAFGGKELILEAYSKAIENKMRFFSYGDSMLII